MALEAASPSAVISSGAGSGIPWVLGEPESRNLPLMERDRPMKAMHEENPMTIRIDGERLNWSLQELARIGATPGGGVTRLAASDEDRAGREQLNAWMAEAGLTVLIDDFGNMTG